MDAVLSVARAVEPDLGSLGWFVILWLACCICGLILSGMLPLGMRATNLATFGGASLAIGNVILLLLLFVGAALFAVSALRISSIVLVASWIFLFVPAVVDALPERWTDSYGGLMVLLGVQTVALTMLYRSGHFAIALSSI